MKIWLERNIVDLAGRALDATVAIEEQLDHRAIRVETAMAWGQYLDLAHY